MAEKMTLPCPFCGGRTVDQLKFVGRSIECQGCGASGPELPLVHHPDEMVRAWNRRAHPAQPAQAVDVDDLAQEIRRVDGNHSLGAGALAEALMPFITRALGNANGKEG